MQRDILILVGTRRINNIVLPQPLGLWPSVRVSKKLKSLVAKQLAKSIDQTFVTLTATTNKPSAYGIARLMH